MKPCKCVAPVLIFCITAVFAGTGEHSFTDRQNEIEDIIGEYLSYTDLLKRYSVSKMDYFRRGLGWQGEGYYGFSTGSRSVSFSDTAVSINEYGQANERILYLVYEKQADAEYFTFERVGGYRMVVGYREGMIHWLDWRFGDGGAISWSPDLISVKYPDDELDYALYYYRQEPMLVLSTELTKRMFYGEKGNDEFRYVIEDLSLDFPYPYLTRLIRAADKEGISLSDEQSLALFCVNWFRENAGLPIISANPALVRAAKNHSDYLIQNGVIRSMASWDSRTADLADYLSLHDEIKGKKGFTGEHIHDRTEYTGYGRNTGECATLSRNEVCSETINWFHTIFHRRPFLDYRTVEYGHGHSVDNTAPEHTAGIANWGYDHSRTAPGLFIYPADGETLVPRAWSGMESPDPFPDTSEPVGVPITVFFSDEKYSQAELKLFDGEGKEVACLESGMLADPNFKEITPAAPLKPGTSYTISLRYKGGEYSHSFTTAPLNPAETGLLKIRKKVDTGTDLLDDTFDPEKALELSASKGTVRIESAGKDTLVSDRKYGFAFIRPPEWEVADRDWQEICLKNGWKSISFHLYARGTDPDLAKVIKNLSANLEYTELKREDVETGLLRGVRVEYEWEHEGQAICYYLIFGDYALGIYGYGVSGEIMQGIIGSFRAWPEAGE